VRVNGVSVANGVNVNGAATNGVHTNGASAMIGAVIETTETAETVPEGVRSRTSNL
jgi:hypothetical protein